MLDEMILSALSDADVDGLVDAPPSVPLPAQVRIVRGAVTRAQVAGLQLPREVIFRWRDGRPEQPTGACVTFEDGTHALYLSVNQQPEELARVALHELQHLADRQGDPSLSDLERERRAIRFANRVMNAAGAWWA